MATEEQSSTRDMVLDAGYSDIIFPSLTRPGGIDMVLYLETFRQVGGRITIHGPDGRLPKDDRG